MQNGVPTVLADDPSLAEAAAARAVAARRDAYADEVRRLVDAAYRVMRRTGATDPRVSDIVAEAGLSNQAFYRHFRGKDELLLTVLDDGNRRLVDTLHRRLARAGPGAPRVRAWVVGVLEQARNPEAAENTRPFAIDGVRLAARFPDESQRSRERLIAPLREAVRDAGGDGTRDADAIYYVAMGWMQDAVVRQQCPARADVEHVVAFALRGIGSAGDPRAGGDDPGNPRDQRSEEAAWNASS